MGNLLHGQLLVIVLVQSVQCIGVVGNDSHKVKRVLGSQYLLRSDSPAQDSDQLFQFSVPLLRHLRLREPYCLSLHPDIHSSLPVSSAVNHELVTHFSLWLLLSQRNEVI